ncbi:MAG: 50S ribosomal protein L2 [Candidatus Coatesbacteria bacterium]
MLKIRRPTTPSQRHRSYLVHENLHEGRPMKSLVRRFKNRGGRNALGRITARHRGGGHKHLYRVVDFKRDKRDIPAVVERIERDPGRRALIALLRYADGERRYVLAPDGLKPGDKVVAGANVEVKVGNALPLEAIPTGIMVHNVELTPGHGGQLARSAGATVQLQAKEGEFAFLKMPSGEVRRVNLTCYATVGQVGNLDWENVWIGSAGRKRWMGRRPHVRGAAMNPVDHPHGGGEGKAGAGRPPVSPWGQKAKGLKTRRPKLSDKWIVQRRP